LLLYSEKDVAGEGDLSNEGDLSSKIDAAGSGGMQVGMPLMDAIARLIEEGYSVQAQKQIPQKLKYRKLMKFQNGEVKEIEAADI
jgi:hypothetical protein